VFRQLIFAWWQRLELQLELIGLSREFTAIEFGQVLAKLSRLLGALLLQASSRRPSTTDLSANKATAPRCADIVYFLVATERAHHQCQPPKRSGVT
jgi:hypothetical protein